MKGPSATTARHLGWIGGRPVPYFSSDHAPFRYQSDKGKNTPFNWIPNGVPSIETHLLILFSEGVNKGCISLNKFVELVSTNPEKMYGLYSRKGSIAVGSDADVVVFDPSIRRIIRSTKLHHNVDYTSYEGMVVDGWPSHRAVTDIDCTT